LPGDPELADRVEAGVAVAEVGRGDEVVGAARTHHADVALLDIEMPGQDGIRAAVAREKGWL
jgi:two-component system response regulator DesR